MTDPTSMPDALDEPTKPQPAIIVAFYSFKGGVGRTQSLYNVAVRLAALQRRVLMIDMDLEAPGLSIGLLDEQERNRQDGFAEIACDLLLDLEAALGDKDADYDALLAEYTDRMARSLYPLPVTVPPQREDLIARLRESFPFVDGQGSLSLLTTGRIDPTYARTMMPVPLAEAFERSLKVNEQKRAKKALSALGHAPLLPDNLGQVFAFMLRHLLRTLPAADTETPYDYILLDARSGLADVGGLCLRGLADTRVMLSGLNRQNLSGTRYVLNTLSDEERSADNLLVVFSPVPEGEITLLEKRLQDATAHLQVDEEDTLLLHYHPRIALEEEAFIRPVHRLARIYEEYERLTDRVQERSGNDAQARLDRAMKQYRDTADDLSPEIRQKRLARDLASLAVMEPDLVLPTANGLCTQLLEEKQTYLEALDFFRIWTALAPDTVEALGNSANYFLKIAKDSRPSDHKNAILLLEQSFRLNNKIIELAPSEDRAWYNWGVGLGDLAKWQYEAGQHEEARSLYHKAFEKYAKAVEIDENKHEAWYNWGVGLDNLAQWQYEAGQHEEVRKLYEQAFEKYAKAVEIDENKHEAWYNWGADLANLAQWQWEIGQQDEARNLYEQAFEKYAKAVEIDENKHEAWYNWGVGLDNLAHWQWEIGQQDEARNLYQQAFEKYAKAVEIDESEYWAWNNWGVGLGDIAKWQWEAGHQDEAHNLYQQAFEKYAKAVEIDENKHAAWGNWSVQLSNLYSILQEVGQASPALIDEAVGKAEQTLALFDDPIAKTILARALTLRGHEEDLVRAEVLVRSLTDTSDVDMLNENPQTDVNTDSA